VSELVLFLGRFLIVSSVGGLALVTVYYLIIAIRAPMRARAKMRMIEHPVVHDVRADDESIPENVRHQLQAHHDALVALGFQPRGMINQAAARTSAAYLALFWHPTMATRAVSRLVLKPKANAEHSAKLSFQIKYDDGTSVELSNSSSVLPGLERIPGLVGQMPQVGDVPRLFGYFVKLVTKYERDTGRLERARIPLADDASVASVYLDELRHSLDIMHRSGLWTMSTEPGVWRPTWRGALMIGAGSITPGSDFVRRRVRGRGERLQRELDADTTRTRAEWIGSRTGWTMFVVGLMMIAAAVVMSPVGALLASMGMSVGWELEKLRRNEPRVRSLLVGGAAAPLLALFAGIPIGLPWRLLWSLLLLLPTSNTPVASEFSVGLWLFPIGVIIAGATLMVEGFRAAAT
jgi:hypothetical protein